jgi:hypothetical protein
MRTYRRVGARAAWRAAALAGAALALAGCGDDSGIPPCVPVSGLVTLDGKPLTDGTVIFLGATEKGGPTGYEPVALIDAQGTYSLVTRHKPGAPPGKYKVVVYWDVPGAGWQKPQSRLPARYSDHAHTPLAVEVVKDPAPGAYDLAMTTKK